MNKRLFLLAIFYIIPSPIMASDSDTLWKRLLHFDVKHKRSMIDNNRFFLSQRGRFDPNSELKKTIQVLKKAKFIELNNQKVDPICLFAARAWYLRNIKKITIPFRDCPNLNTWRKTLKIRSISVVYAASYAGNAASMFGHTFLKINLSSNLTNKSINPYLLDFGFAFFAAANSSDGISYVLKGLSGGYEGFYIIQPYYQLLNQYNFIEGRDLWEYEIELNKEQQKLLNLHLWELINSASAPYYFTHKNCTSMLIGIFEVLFPDVEFKNQISGFAYPSDLVRAISSKLPIKRKEYRPSIRHKIASRWEALDNKEKSDLLKLWNGETTIQSNKNPKVLDIALDLINLEKAKLDLPEQAKIREKEKHLLLQRSLLKSKKPNKNPLPNSEPIRMHKASKIGLGPEKYGKSFGSNIELRYGWHSLLDPTSGYTPYYQFDLFDLSYYQSFKIKENEQRYDFKVADVVSFSPITPYEDLWSWAMNGGVKKESISSYSHLYFEGSIGKTVELNPKYSILIGALPFIDLKAPLNQKDKGELRGGMNLILLGNTTKAFKHNLNITYNCPLLKKSKQKKCKVYPNLTSQFNYQIDYYLKFNAKKDEKTIVSLILGAYI